VDIRQLLEPAYLDAFQRVEEWQHVWNNRANIFESNFKIFAMFEGRQTTKGRVL